jgi:hypothetical protein
MGLKADTGRTTSAANVLVEAERFGSGALVPPGGRSQFEPGQPQMSQLKALVPAAIIRRRNFSP